MSQTTVMGDAWRRGQSVAVHGWIYDLRDGLLRDLHCTSTSPADANEEYSEALAGLETRD